MGEFLKKCWTWIVGEWTPLPASVKVGLLSFVAGFLAGKLL